MGSSDSWLRFLALPLAAACLAYGACRAADPVAGQRPIPQPLPPNAPPPAVAPSALDVAPQPVAAPTVDPLPSLWRDGTFGSDCGEGCSAQRYAFLWNDLSVFGGLDGFKEPEDLGVNAHFGMRGAFNWGLPVWEKGGLGVQFGSAVNYTNNAVRVLQSVTNTHDDLENFTTVGLFQRSDFGLNWGVVQDWRFEDYYRHTNFAQVRGQLGYAITGNDEIGLWGSLRERGQNAAVGTASFTLRPIDQGNLYWRHVWPNETVTRLWVGMAEGHGRFLLVSPGEAPVHHPVTFGAELFVPLTERLAIFGEAHFITPNDTGTVDATLGFAFYPGAGALRASRSRFAPLLPVGNNATFPIDLRQ